MVDSFGPAIPVIAVFLFKRTCVEMPSTLTPVVLPELFCVGAGVRSPNLHKWPAKQCLRMIAGFMEGVFRHWSQGELLDKLLPARTQVCKKESIGYYLDLHAQAGSEA